MNENHGDGAMSCPGLSQCNVSARTLAPPCYTKRRDHVLPSISRVTLLPVLTVPWSATDHNKEYIHNNFRDTLNLADGP